MMNVQPTRITIELLPNHKFDEEYPEILSHAITKPVFDKVIQKCNEKTSKIGSHLLKLIIALVIGFLCPFIGAIITTVGSMLLKTQWPVIFAFLGFLAFFVIGIGSYMIYRNNYWSIFDEVSKILEEFNQKELQRCPFVLKKRVIRRRKRTRRGRRRVVTYYEPYIEVTIYPQSMMNQNYGTVVVNHPMMNPQFNQQQMMNPQMNQQPMMNPQMNQQQMMGPQFNQQQMMNPQFNEPQMMDPQFNPQSMQSPMYYT